MADNSTNLDQDSPAEETPAAETPAEETPAAETPAEETPAAETPELEPEQSAESVPATPQPDVSVPEDLQIIGVSPMEPPSHTAGKAPSPEGEVEPQEDTAGLGDQGKDKDEEDPEVKRLIEEMEAQQSANEEMRLLNQQEHLQKVLEHRYGQGLPQQYLDQVQGFKYDEENDALKINIGFGKTITDHGHSVEMGMGFFDQRAAEMLIAVTKTHQWAQERPIKLHGFKSAKNKMWLACMHQGVAVDPTFQPSQKYIDMWNNDPLNPKNQNKPQEPEVDTDASQRPKVTPLEAEAEQSMQAPAQDAAKQDSIQQTLPEANDPPPSDAEVDEYKAQVDAKISSTIDDLSGQDGQADHVAMLRETQEALQTGTFDVKQLEAVDNAVTNRNFSVALATVKPDALEGAKPVRPTVESATPKPVVKNDGMKV